MSWISHLQVDLPDLLSGADLSNKEGYAARLSAGTYLLARNADEAVGVISDGGSASGDRVSVKRGLVLASFASAHATVPLSYGGLTVDANGQFKTATEADRVCAWTPRVATAAGLRPIFFDQGHRRDTHFTLTAAAEAANAIAVTMAASRQSATPHYIAEVLDADFEPTSVADWTIVVTGGAAVSTDTRPRVLFNASATGGAVLTVTDVSAAYVGDVYLLVRPVDIDGPAVLSTLTFA